MKEGWRRDGGGVEEGWRRGGGGMEEGWRRDGGGVEIKTKKIMSGNKLFYTPGSLVSF